MKKEFSLEGIDFPRNLPEFEERFATETACLEYLREQRWPDGFRCGHCKNDKGWLNGRGLMECRACHHQTSLTSGTIFHKTRLPIRVWFRAMWLVCTQKTGLSAAGLQRTLGLKSIQTAWVWLHKMRKAMVRLEREPLTGMVQIDDVLLRAPDGRGEKAGVRVAIAVEMDPVSEEIGRIRLKEITRSPESGLLFFIRREIARQAILETDDRDLFAHLDHTGGERRVVAHQVPGQYLPKVRRVLPLLQRWLLGTHQGRVERKHLQGYLDEFVFRFNRRKSPHVGLLFQRLVSQGLMIQATTYQALTAADPGT